MPRARITGKKSRPAKRRRRKFKGLQLLRKLFPSARSRRRWYRAFRGAPAGVQLLLVVVCAFVLWLGANWTYQVVRKPSELFFPVSGTLYKAPFETWRQYKSLFRKHSTATLTPEFLAALAQVEGSGNPIVRTYWRWSFSSEPFNVYKPASSAVGMYQITNGTFDEAKRYCIHDHVVVEDGPWNDMHSCWLNSLYTRTFPSHAVELTAAYLDRRVAGTLQRLHIAAASSSLDQRQTLAAVIHLCGAGAGDRFARRKFRFALHQRCGDHDAAGYVGRVKAMQAVFLRLAAQTGN